ncbi:MAG: hypothetical protein IJT65_01745, partial [Eubacterium sp.]|nr:hypothetical protein [Eubacterium sp.]
MLQLVLGRAGTGKTEYVFRSIQKKIDEGEKNLLLITPEQFSFSAQKRLLTDLGESRVNEVEESSFSRLCTEISKKYGSNRLPLLSKGAKAVLMKRAVESVQDSLVLFNNNIDKVSFINLVISVYDEMKSCRVTSEDIFKASDESERETLSLKLKDIALIISAYDALINNEYNDPANELTRLYHTLNELNYFENRTVYIDGFSGFVAQEYKIIEVILKQAKEVYITFCSDSFNDNEKFTLFSYVNSNIAILKDVASKINVEINEPIILNKNLRAQNDELLFAEKYAFSNTIEKYKNDVNHIKLYNSVGVTDECDFVARSISSLLREGYRANEISVVCRDLEKYQSELSASFNKYKIPFFDDERQSIKSQPLIMFISFLLRIMIYSYRSEDIFSLLKTGLTNLDNEKISTLENYVFLWNINGSKWKKEFTESTKGFVENLSENDKSLIKDLNESREYIINILNKFQRKIKNASCGEICKALYYTLIDFSVNEKLKELAFSLEKEGKSALSEEQGRIWDMLIDILDSL